MASPVPPRLLVVWDFDRSFLQEDCEWSTFDHFGLEPEARRLSQTEFQGRWPACTDFLFGKLAAGWEGQAPVSKAELCAAVATLDGTQPIPAMRAAAEAVGAARAAGVAVEQRVLSDANTALIDVVLEQQGLREVFTTVLSNPAWWEGERLRAEPYLAVGEAAKLPPATDPGGLREFTLAAIPTT